MISYSALYKFFSDERNKPNKINYQKLISRGENFVKAERVISVSVDQDKTYQICGQVKPSLKAKTKDNKTSYDVKVSKCYIDYTLYCLGSYIVNIIK